jgi:Zn-finger protein
MRSLYRGPSKDASYQISIHLAKRFQRRFFRNQPIRNKNCLWWPCLLTEQDEISNLYRGPSIDVSYQASVHLAKRFQSREDYFRNCPITNKNCLWWPCLLMDRDKMSNLYRGPSIDASYQVSVHLAEGFRINLNDLLQGNLSYWTETWEPDIFQQINLTEYSTPAYIFFYCL